MAETERCGYSVCSCAIGLPRSNTDASKLPERRVGFLPRFFCRMRHVFPQVRHCLRREPYRRIGARQQGEFACLFIIHANSPTKQRLRLLTKPLSQIGINQIFSFIPHGVSALGTSIVEGLMQVKKLVVDDELCIGSTCITESELTALLEQSQITNPKSRTNSNDQNANNQIVPTITIQGNNGESVAPHVSGNESATTTEDGGE